MKVKSGQERQFRVGDRQHLEELAHRGRPGFDQALDTEDESDAVRRQLGNEPLALVTSAWHMPRSVALFRAAGMDPLPCPTDFCAADDGSFHWRDLLWDIDSLERSTWAVRERIGCLWLRLRGKI